MPEHKVFYEHIPKGLPAKQLAALDYVKGYGWKCEFNGATICRECQSGIIQRMDAMSGVWERYED
jgi:hypothetical protein